eukprot:UN29056
MLKKLAEGSAAKLENFQPSSKINPLYRAVHVFFKENCISNGIGLNLDGFHRLVQSLQIKFPRCITQKIFEAVDEHHLGHVTYSQFIQFLQDDTRSAKFEEIYSVVIDELPFGLVLEKDPLRSEHTIVKSCTSTKSQ